jgi:hypothetical protein
MKNIRSTLDLFVDRSKQIIVQGPLFLPAAIALQTEKEGAAWKQKTSQAAPFVYILGPSSMSACAVSHNYLVLFASVPAYTHQPITARKELVMAITDTPSSIAEVPVKRRMRAEAYISIVGIVAVVLLGIARFVYEPSYEARQTAAQVVLTSEHQKVCEQLGKSSGADRDNCLKALDALYIVHQQAILADSSEI